LGVAANLATASLRQGLPGSGYSLYQQPSQMQMQPMMMQPMGQTVMVMMPPGGAGPVHYQAAPMHTMPYHGQMSHVGTQMGYVGAHPAQMGQMALDGGVMTHGDPAMYGSVMSHNGVLGNGVSAYGGGSSLYTPIPPVAPLASNAAHHGTDVNYMHTSRSAGGTVSFSQSTSQVKHEHSLHDQGHAAPVSSSSSTSQSGDRNGAGQQGDGDQNTLDADVASCLLNMRSPAGNEQQR
jgi:hypothetical protein